MKFNFSRQGLSKDEGHLERIFEIVPAAASWTALLGMLVIAFWKPVVAAVVIIAFDFYWLLRLFYMTLFLILAYLRLWAEKETDWISRAEGLGRLPSYLKEIRGDVRRSTPRKKISLWAHRRELETLAKSGASVPRSSEIFHLVIFPILRESKEIIEPGIQSLVGQKFPPQRILVVYAVEERVAQKIKEQAFQIQKGYRRHFLDFLVVVHPDGLPGEARVKGANTTYAAKEAAKFLTARGIPFEKVIVSCFDADTVVSPDYFGCLTYHFLVCPERNRASFQPIPVYHNNIWEASGFSRVLDIGSSFFQLIEATNPDRLVTFSSHSMSFQALVEVGYWPVELVSDDSAIFWKAFIHYDGDYRVIPMYVTLSMDVVSAETWWKTIAYVYRQKRRWAWGVENFPIVMRAFLRANRISLWTRVSHGFKLFENNISWATWAFLLLVIGWLPAVFASREFSDTVLYYSAPRITSTIFNLASLALLTTVILSVCLLPKKKVKHPFLKSVGFALEWLLVPFIVTFLSALPALDAQTRLALAKYLEFSTTEKERKPG